MSIRFRVTIEYEYEVTHEGMANYDDQDPKAMAAVDREVLSGDPDVLFQDLGEIPFKLTVEPV